MGAQSKNNTPAGPLLEPPIWGGHPNLPCRPHSYWPNSSAPILRGVTITSPHRTDTTSPTFLQRQSPLPCSLPPPPTSTTGQIRRCATPTRPLPRYEGAALMRRELSSHLRPSLCVEYVRKKGLTQCRVGPTCHCLPIWIWGPSFGDVVGVEAKILGTQKGGGSGRFLPDFCTTFLSTLMK